MAKILVHLIFFFSHFCFINADLNEYLKNYEIIYPSFTSLKASSSHNSTHFTFKAYNQTFDLFLRESERLPTLHHSEFRLLDANGTDKSKNLLLSFTYYKGYLRDHPFSTASITVSKNGDDIMGHIDIENETYFIESHTALNETIIYKASDLIVDFSKFGRKGHSLLVPECPKPRHYFDKFSRVKRTVNKRGVKKNRCEMKLVADYEFYKVIGNNNYYSAARYLINVIERINNIFTAVNWGITGRGEQLVNLGFLVKEIKIYNHPTPREDPYNFHFNNEFGDSGTNQFNIEKLMFSFSEFEGSNASCVTVLVTAKIINDGILGYAHVGNTKGSVGMCANQPHNDFYSNTAVVTVMKREGLMLTRIFDLVFAHELGHLWKSSHDTEQCSDPQNSRFIMHETSNTGYDKNNYRFSICTINQVHKVLYHLQPKCFVEEVLSLCGNGILEPGEECDAGGRFVAEQRGESDGIADDPCCTHNCKLRPHALCSPKHAECCSAQCIYHEANYACQPRDNDTCLAASYCTGESPTCPVQGYVEEGTPCADDGTCNSRGQCVPFCEKKNKESRPCMCENLSDSCYRCCKIGEYGKCLPIIPLQHLKEGAICVLGYCRNRICEKEPTEIVSHYWRLLKDVNQTPKSKIFGDYLVFVVVFIVSLIWIPCAFLVHQRDKKSKIIPEDEIENKVTFVHEKIHLGNGSSANGTAA